MEDKQIAFTVPGRVHTVYKTACAKLGRTMTEDLRRQVLLTLQEADMMGDIPAEDFAYLWSSGPAEV